MERLISLLPTAGAFAAAVFALMALCVPSSAMAQSCAVDAIDGSCVHAGQKCGPPAGGKCRTTKTPQQFVCTCVAPSPQSPTEHDKPTKPAKDAPPPEALPQDPPQPG